MSDRKRNSTLCCFISKLTIIPLVRELVYIEYHGSKAGANHFHRVLCVQTSNYSSLRESQSLLSSPSSHLISPLLPSPFLSTPFLSSHLCRSCPPSAVVPEPGSGTFPCSAFFLQWLSLFVRLLLNTCKQTCLSSQLLFSSFSFQVLLRFEVSKSLAVFLEK